MTMLKLCRCNKPIPITDKHCVTCASQVKSYTKARNKQRYKEYDAKRDKKYVQFYNSKEWKDERIGARSLALARDNGLCVMCLSNKLARVAEVVDHIIPVKISWELRLNVNNLQSLCNKCHARKTRDDKKKYAGLL